MSGYSVVVLICSMGLSHSDCQPKTALDVVRGPKVENVVMCSLYAQAMMARSDLVQGDHYMKVVCTPSENAEQWLAELQLAKPDVNPTLRPSSIEDRTYFTYSAGAERIPESTAPNTRNKSHIIVAHVNQPGDGVLVAAGGSAGGYALFVKDGRPIYEYNWFGRNRYRIASSEPLPPGESTIRVEFKYDGGGSPTKVGHVTMFLNDVKVADGRLDKTMLGRFSVDETFDIGADTGSPVSDQYASPFQFAGAINRVEVELGAEE